MEEYLKTLLEQIRCKKARSLIEEELRGHLEEQIEENRMSGMEPEEAEKAAVLDMGDPVQTGISLDGIHRPQISWRLVILVGAVSLLSIVLQMAAGLSQNPAGGIAGGLDHSLYVIFGFALMLIVYRMDYSFLGRNALWVTLGFILMLLFFRILSMPINGTYIWLSIGNVSISLGALLYLWPPLYGALLYRYYGQGYKGVAKCFLWTLFPLWYAWTFPDIGLAFVIFFCKYDPFVSWDYSGMVPDQEGKDSGCYMGSVYSSAGFLPFVGSVFSWI